MSRKPYNELSSAVLIPNDPMYTFKSMNQKAQREYKNIEVTTINYFKNFNETDRRMDFDDTSPRPVR